MAIIPGVGLVPVQQAASYGYTQAPATASAPAPQSVASTVSQPTATVNAGNISDLVSAVKTGQMTQEQAYKAALERTGGNPGGTTSQQQIAAQVKNSIYSVNRMVTPTTISTTTGTGTSSSTTNQAGDNKQYLIDTYKADVAAGRPANLASYGLTQADLAGTGTSGSQDASGGTIGSQTGAPQTNNGVPTPIKTGNPVLDAAQDKQYQYVIGSLEKGFTINPALTGTSLAAMLPQFIKETASAMEPELLQNFQTEMAGVNLSLDTLSKQYTASQGKTIQDFQSTIGQLRNANMWGFGGAENAVESASAANTNRSLESLNAGFENQAGGVMQAAGKALGSGVPSDFLSSTGAPGLSGLSGFSASSVLNPNVSPLQVSLQGGNSVLSGSATGGRTLNYNYDPNIYKYGDIPTAFGQNFATGLNQRFGNYQAGAAATGFSSPTFGNTL